MATVAYGIQGLQDDSSDVSMFEASQSSSSEAQKAEEETVIRNLAPGGGVVENGQAQVQPKMDPRAYQLEMLDASLKENVIVAMDTGSGKTQIALLRIQAELDTCSPDKIIWFLAPTVILCSQQYRFIETQLPAVPLKLLTGNENVDNWSGHTWDTILRDTRIVVSTPDVLHDALGHAYVRMEKLALIIFDEAHNCVAKASARRIMLQFYHVQKGIAPLPAILGLSATPSMKGQQLGLENVEQTLDARCVTPTIHREDLLKHANRPLIRSAGYSLPENIATTSINSLRQVWHGLDIKDDPYVVSLLENLTEENEVKLRKALSRDETYCQQQLKGLFNRSLKMARELGVWSSNRYLKRVIEESLEKIRKSDDSFDQGVTKEKLYLGEVLEQVQLCDVPEVPSDFSEKVSILIRELLAAAESQSDRPVCVVFARERATVSMLFELLAVTPSLSSTFRMGAVVGTSQFSGKKSNIYDLLSNVNDISVLQKFRSGAINLLIATSVLEEGIDVPACNLVICFDEPDNFKSFVQRRGRARMRASSLFIFFECGSRIVRQWEAMEEEMKRQYQDEDREHQTIMELEAYGDEDGADLVLRVESTGARLGLDEAKGHLSHFCQKLWRGEFADVRPVYVTEEHPGALITCKVILPTFLPAEVRETESSRPWDTENNAKKDAALQAYIRLYHAGLVNDHLLPYTPKEIPGVEEREAIAVVEHSFNPWTQVAQDWKAGKLRWMYTCACIDEDSNVLGEYDIVLPAELPQARTVTTYMDFGIEWRLTIRTRRQLEEHEEIPDHTSALLAAVFGHRWSVLDKPHIVQVSVNNSNANINVSRTGIGARDFNVETDQNQDFLVRDASDIPFTFQELLPSKPPMESVRHLFEDYELAPDDVPYVVLKKWTKRSDFLHPLFPGNKAPATEGAKPYGWVLPVDAARVDNVPAQHVQFGMLIPSVIHELTVLLTVKHLTENLLEPVGFSDTQLVREAISSRAALEPYQYERLENLGDSILKYCTAIQAFSSHPEWPEGYLSFFKDLIVSNSRLSRAAKEKGLAKYILTNSFTGLKWRPLYLDDVLKDDDSTKKRKDRELSTKTLADVVEALIGAAYQDGGIEKATKCLSVFIDDQKWRLPTDSRQLLYDMQPEVTHFPKTMGPVEELIGYKFNNRSFLLEALTHASYMGALRGRSYERLEFLGDALLDKIIISRLFAVEPPLRHDQMHTLKTAMVNGDFLAFVSLDYGLYRDETAVLDGTVATEQVALPLWKFMRHSFPAMGLAQSEAEKRYRELRDEILEAMNSGTHYPWALFARLRVHKFFSDAFEAMLGAVWLDSGSLEACEEIIARFGIFKYLERILQDGVECQHPKELLGKCAVEKKVKYEIESLDIGNGCKEFTCAVYVGDQLITKVEDGVGSEEVKTKAATDAVRIMTAKMDDMMLDLDLNDE